MFTKNSNPVIRSANLLGTPFAGLSSKKAKHGLKEDYLKNVDMTVEGNILTIKVDLSKEFGPSSPHLRARQSSSLALRETCP